MLDTRTRVLRFASLLLGRFALPMRCFQFEFGEIDIVKVPECTRTKVAIIILCHGCPDAVPSRLLGEFQGKREMFDVPSTLRRLGPLVSGVLQLDQARVGYR